MKESALLLSFATATGDGAARLLSSRFPITCLDALIGFETDYELLSSTQLLLAATDWSSRTIGFLKAELLDTLKSPSALASRREIGSSRFVWAAF